MRAAYLLGMNLSIEYQSRRLPSPKWIEEKPAYLVGVAGLILLWAVYSAVTVLVVVAIFIPGHLGLSDWLRGLANPWPVDSPRFTT
ncbi:MAG TPA: hypothetical protein VN939_13095 [Chthoniobacterales bacterium]|jgi:hypothetical protein|nr:hypothetical protein [Chthoniobacterales bacterium]